MYYSLLIVALLECGEPMTLEAAAAVVLNRSRLALLISLPKQCVKREAGGSWVRFLRVDHVFAGRMFWFPQKKFVGSYFCLSAASRW